MLFLLIQHAFAGDVTVIPGDSIQDALNQAVAGDTITIQAGTYNEELITVTDATQSAPITIKAANGEQVILTANGEVLQVEHAWYRVENIIFDGQYGNKDTLDIRGGANNLLLSGVEVRHSNRDCIDIKSPSNVTIEDSLIHHCISWDGERVDAHGIVAGNASGLTIRNTEIHTFSGDGIQIDPDRQSPPWNDLLIEDCHIWLSPLAEETNGFPAGLVPGENAFDSKTWDDSTERANVTIRRTKAHGFRNGYITNMSAFNIKESVDVLVDKVLVYDSEIAFRLRGPGRDIGAAATIQNSVIYDVDFAFRYEDEIETVNIWNTTLGNEVSTPFKEASSDTTTPDVRNLLIVAEELPVEAQSDSNIVTDSSSFVDAANHDYHLVEGAAAIDSGESIAIITDDMDGLSRPFGDAFDIGAYELHLEEEDPEDTGLEDTGNTETEEPSNPEPSIPDTEDTEANKEENKETGGGSCATGNLPIKLLPLWLLMALAIRRRKRT